MTNGYETMTHEQDDSGQRENDKTTGDHEQPYISAKLEVAPDEESLDEQSDDSSLCDTSIQR